MENKTFKKLQLKKEVVARLNKEDLQKVIGGNLVTTESSCGMLCATGVGYDRAQIWTLPFVPFGYITDAQNGGCWVGGGLTDTYGGNYCGSDMAYTCPGASCGGPC
jgi:hypothetical protein